MAEPIGSGDFVECVRSDCLPSTMRPLSINAIYQVRDAYLGLAVGGVRLPALRLVGVQNGMTSHGAELSYRADRFRPIYRPKASLIQQLLAPPRKAPATPSHVQAHLETAKDGAR